MRHTLHAGCGSNEVSNVCQEGRQLTQVQARQRLTVNLFIFPDTETGLTVMVIDAFDRVYRIGGLRGDIACFMMFKLDERLVTVNVEEIWNHDTCEPAFLI